MRGDGAAECLVCRWFRPAAISEVQLTSRACSAWRGERWLPVHGGTGTRLLFPSPFDVLKSHLLYRTTRVGSGFSKVFPTLILPCSSELRWSSWCSGLAGGHRGRCFKCGADAHLGTKAATYSTVSHLKEPFEPYSLHGDLSEYCWSAGDSGACG